MTGQRRRSPAAVGRTIARPIVIAMELVAEPGWVTRLARLQNGPEFCECCEHRSPPRPRRAAGGEEDGQPTATADPTRHKAARSNRFRFKSCGTARPIVAIGLALPALLLPMGLSLGVAL
jgi:hypothetical protein